ncbi:MAG: DUF2066 domain-containing protein [Gammaproteobacteria bacterium]|nr:DUF2066 domain-containing protein [Gammaproteobacteria bacterium]
MKIVKPLAIQLILVLAGFCILNTSPILAKEVEGLFEISVAVDDRSNSKRKQATREALTEIMIRISGQSAAASNSVVTSRLKKSSAYIQRYLYREKLVIDNEGNAGEQLMLDLFFDEISLRNLLRDSGLPRWGSNRPQVLVWLAIGDQQQRFLMGTDGEALLPLMISRQSTEGISTRQSTQGQETTAEPEESHIDLRQILSDKAAERGLPILIPLMDLEDEISIDVADVWGRFVQPIRQASLRYDSDAILASQLMQLGDIWQTRWLLLHKGRTLSWELESESIEGALTAGIDTTADQLAEQYAVLEDSLQRNELLISVSNIQQVEDYAHLIDYLENLTSISNVNVAKVNGSTIQLRVNLIGEQKAMLQLISLNNKLLRESMPLFDADGVITQLPSLFFRWNTEVVDQ